MHLALAGLVVAALSHCSWEESRELALKTRSLAQRRLGLPTPLEAPIHDCAHECGCICRGATIVAAVDTSPFAANDCELLPLDLRLPAGARCDECTDNCQRRVQGDFFVPRLSGRQLRALYASLVI